MHSRSQHSFVKVWGGFAVAPTNAVGHQERSLSAGAAQRSAIPARSHPINGLRTTSDGNREKSRSADHNSATPCERQMAAMRAS